MGIKGVTAATPQTAAATSCVRYHYRVVGVIATNLSVAPSFSLGSYCCFSIRPASLLRVCVRPAERLAAW